MRGIFGVPRRPIVAIVVDEGQALVDGQLVTHLVPEPLRADPRQAALYVTRGIAVELGRPVRATAHDELGRQDLIVDVDGTAVTARSPRATLGARAAFAAAAVAALGLGAVVASGASPGDQSPQSSTDSPESLPTPTATVEPPAPVPTTPAPVPQRVRVKVRGGVEALTVAVSTAPLRRASVRVVVTGPKGRKLSKSIRTKIAGPVEVTFKDLGAGRHTWRVVTKRAQAKTGAVVVMPRPTPPPPPPPAPEVDVPSYTPEPEDSPGSGGGGGGYTPPSNGGSNGGSSGGGGGSNGGGSGGSNNGGGGSGGGGGGGNPPPPLQGSGDGPPPIPLG